MAEANWQDTELTSEEKIASLLLARHGESPPVNVRRIAVEYARIEEDAFTVSCDAVTIRDPDGSERPLLLLNKNSTSLETRKRFTISHEIGHLKIPWHCGSIACHIDEGEASFSGDHYSLEGEAHRFASELLMPTEWVKRVIAEESSIEKIYKRVLNIANVSRTAARIKLMKTLPPGFVCVDYDPATGQIVRIDESGRGFLSLFIEPGDRTSFQRLSKALEFHAVDGHEFRHGVNRMRWWRLDCSCTPPGIDVRRSSVDILRGIAEDLFDTRSVQNKGIFAINGYASDGYQKALNNSVDSIFGSLKLRFGKKELRDISRVRAMMAHPLWEEYLIAKSVELANWLTD